MKTSHIILGICFCMNLAFSAPLQFVHESLGVPRAKVPNPSQVKIVTDNLQKATGLLQNGFLKTPSSIHLLVLYQASNASFDPVGNILVTSIELSVDGTMKSTKMARDLELHELGHAIFHANLSFIAQKVPAHVREFVKGAKSFPLWEKQSRTYRSGRGRISAFEEVDDYDSVEKVQDQIYELGNLLNHAATETNTPYGNFWYLMTPLHPLNEFFADTFATIVTDDPNAMASIQKATDPHGMKHFDRSFDAKISLRPQDGTDHHLHYSSSRLHIYKNYLNKPQYKKKGKRWLVEKTLTAIQCRYPYLRDDKFKFERESLGLRLRSDDEKQKYVVVKMAEAFNTCIDQAFSSQ